VSNGKIVVNEDLKYIEQTGNTWFQTFALFWTLHSFFGWFPGIWILCANVSEHCQFHRHRWCKQDSSCSHHLWRWNWQSVPKHRHLKFKCRGITQRKNANG